MRIALVNCRVLPEPDPDEGPLLSALAARGHDASCAAWDDGRIDWGAFDAAVVRATWDYAHRPEAFASWIDRAGAATVLLNPPGVLRANLHKSYLLGLERRGIATIPTEFLSKGSPRDPGPIARSRGWDRIVIKPSVSAGSFATRAFDLPRELDAARAFLAQMLRERDMMVQRYMPSVARSGEVSMVHIDGGFSHAVRKHPRFEGEDESVERFEGVTDAHLDLARRVLEESDARDLLYARVDLIEDDDARPMLSELELLEPSLFLPHDAHAAERMARAIGRRVEALVP